MGRPRKEAIAIQIDVKIDSACVQPRVVIHTAVVTPEIQALVLRFSGESSPLLCGFRGETAEPLEPQELIRVYAGGGKVFAATERGEYTLRLRLYEVEERLAGGPFVRISHGEIINLKKVRSFDLSLAGSICARLTDGTAAYVSRRYVSKVKQRLGI